MLGSWLSLGPAYTLFSRRSRLCLAACSGSWLSLGPAYTGYSVYLSALGSPMSGCMFGLESTVLLWYTKSELLIHGFHANQGRAAHTGTMGIAARVDRGRTPLTAHGPRPLADDGGRPSRTASTTSSYYVLATSRGALEHLLEDAACGGLPHARHDKRHDAIPKRSWVS
jgi:hypothetical protein